MIIKWSKSKNSKGEERKLICIHFILLIALTFRTCAYILAFVQSFIYLEHNINNFYNTFLSLNILFMSMSSIVASKFWLNILKYFNYRQNQTKQKILNFIQKLCSASWIIISLLLIFNIFISFFSTNKSSSDM